MSWVRSPAALQAMKSNSLRSIIDQTSALHRADILSGAWWHSINLGGEITPGIHPLEELESNYRHFALPKDLTGKRILDVGCWDGFYSFEAEKHGAEVVAVDCWSPPNFFTVRQALNSRVEFREMNVYEVSREQIGSFDIVLFLGVLYHLHHPLLALQRLCEVTREVAIIETYIIDNTFPTRHPVMEFYEFEELGGQYDNWWGPSSECLMRMLRTAGFARLEVLQSQPTRIVVKAHRRWDEGWMRPSQNLHIAGVTNAITFDHHLPCRGRYAFLAIWVDGLPEQATRDTVRVEVGKYGINPYFVGRSTDPQDQNRTQINTIVPPGLDAGATTVRVIYEKQHSDEKRINLSEGSDW